jgi:AraC-like DNA-binding protein
VGYREFAPDEALSDLVACTWEREAGGRPTRVLPDGCVDLVWRSGELVVAGPDTGPVRSPARAGEHVIGLRFRTGAAGPALGLPASALRDARVPLEELWDGELADQLGEAPAPERRRLLELAILARRPRIAGPDPVVLEAVRRLGRPGSQIGGLADVLGTSERQLLRRFQRAVGYGPKTLDRVLRFQRFRRRGAGGDLARAAFELGYADQAHLTRECVRLSGTTPARLAA